MHEVCHTMRRYLLFVGVVYCQESQMAHRIWKIFLFVGVVYCRESQMAHRIWKIFLFVGVIYCRESQMPHRIIRNQQSDGIISAKKPRSQEAKKSFAAHRILDNFQYVKETNNALPESRFHKEEEKNYEIRTWMAKPRPDGSSVSRAFYR